MHHPAIIAVESGFVPLLIALFGAGLAGGFTHCAGMCGPFVLTQVTGLLSDVPAERMSELTRLRGAVLLPYHLGRLVTYTALGAAAGGLAGQIEEVTGLRWVAVALLAAAALAFVLQGAARIAAWAGLPGGIAAFAHPALGRIGSLVAAAARPLLEPGQETSSGPSSGSATRRFCLGLVLGFLPCGLLYGALAAAAGAGGVIQGGLAMTAFALGTIPGLAAVGFAGHLALRGRAAPALSALSGALFLMNGFLLAYLSYRAAL